MGKKRSARSVILTLAGATVAGLLIHFAIARLGGTGRISLERLLSSRTEVLMEEVGRFEGYPVATRREVISLLRSVLRRDEESERRFRAALALHQLQPPDVEEDFLEALADSEARVRASAATSLGAYGYVPAVPGLVGLLCDPDVTVRRSAIYALGEIGSHDCIEALKSLPRDALEDSLTRQRVQAALESADRARP
ncbi:MAG: HEAT repeat domain-containing protein [Planctomycetes bacterium]|nr:HEAT repeat domain-containing protein [Planctomycetota bacterium]